MVNEQIIRQTQDLANRISKEMFVLALTYNGYSLQEIGNVMGIGPERVRQIKRKALLRVKLKFKEYSDGKAL